MVSIVIALFTPDNELLELWSELPELFEWELVLERLVVLEVDLPRLDFDDLEVFEPLECWLVRVRLVLSRRGKSSFRLQTNRFGPHALVGGGRWVEKWSRNGKGPRMRSP